MCGPVRVNLKGFVASERPRAQAIGRFRLPGPIGPSTTPGGRARKRVPARREYSSHSAKPMSARTPAIGLTKYSIMPLVCGWLTSKRYNSPSHTKSRPACSCVWITTRIASASACSEGDAASQSGSG